MKEYINNMLHLTADIAEELLALKDSGRDIDEALCLKIDQLALIANSNLGSTQQVETSEPETTPTELEIAGEPEPEAEAEIHVYDEPEAEAEQEIMESEAIATAEEEPISLQSSMPAPDAIELTDEMAEAESAVFEEASDALETHHVQTGTIETAITETPDAVQQPVPAITAAQLRNLFTLNDTFLFRRALFGGSAERFNNALEHIAALPSVDAVKEYLSESCHINIKTDEAKDFISSISQLFV